MNITTNRLLLRPIQANDATAMFAYRSNATANKFQGWVPKTLREVVDRIAQLPETFDIAGSWFQMGIVLKESNQLIGDIGIHFLEGDNQQVEIGFTLDQHFQGKGFATEALSAVIDELFIRIKKHRIMASVDPENKPSIALLERLGFRKEAHHLESLLINGKWVDDVVFALLKREWINRT